MLGRRREEEKGRERKSSVSQRRRKEGEERRVAASTEGATQAQNVSYSPLPLSLGDSHHVKELVLLLAHPLMELEDGHGGEVGRDGGGRMRREMEGELEIDRVLGWRFPLEADGRYEGR